MEENRRSMIKKLGLFGGGVIAAHAAEKSEAMENCPSFQELSEIDIIESEIKRSPMLKMFYLLSEDGDYCDSMPYYLGKDQFERIHYFEEIPVLKEKLKKVLPIETKFYLCKNKSVEGNRYNHPLVSYSVYIDVGDLVKKEGWDKFDEMRNTILKDVIIDTLTGLRPAKKITKIKEI